MTQLTILQAADYARAAGFAGDNLVIAVAVAYAESGLRTDALHINVDGSHDRGLYQINSRWHSEVTDAEAFDPANAARAACSISKGGADWSPWATFTGGSYAHYLPQVRAALQQQPVPAPSPSPGVTKPQVMVVGTAGQNVFHGIQSPKVAIVYHIMQGTLAACDAWFSNPAAQASANYGIGRDGSIHQYVDPEGTDAPWANGLLQNPDATVQALVARMGNANPNYWTVSIEHEGNSGDALTAAQLDATAHLSAWLIERFGIPNDEDHLTGHYEYDSVTRAQCPGWNRQQWLAVEAAINSYLKLAPVPTPQPAPTPDPTTAMHEALHQLTYACALLADPASDPKQAIKQTSDRCTAVAALLSPLL